MNVRTLISCFVLVVTAAAAAGAQTVDPADSLRTPHTNFALFTGGTFGLSDRTNVKMFRAGARVGRVLTSTHAGGTFELGAEFAPVDYTFWGGYGNVYGLSATPVLMKWNFVGSRPRRVVPFVLAHGGLLWTRENIPPGDTSRVNFTSVV